MDSTNKSIIVKQRNFVLMTFNHFTLSQRFGRVLMYQPSTFPGIGVDHGAKGAAAAAPIVWLDVVLLKWRAFSSPKQTLPCTPVNVSVGLLRCCHKGLVRNRCHKHGLRVWQSRVNCLIVLCNNCPDDQCLHCSSYNPAFMVVFFNEFLNHLTAFYFNMKDLLLHSILTGQLLD